MSDTKTLDPKAKQSQLSDADKRQARETAAGDNLEAEQAEAARQAEVKDLNQRYNAPSYTPPAQESEPQQEQQPGPNMGDTPIETTQPEDQDQSGGNRRSAERAKKWRDSYKEHKERLGNKRAEKKAARAAKRTEKGLQKGQKGLETGGKAARAGGNVSRVGAAGEGAAGAGEAAGAAGTAAGGAGAAGAGGVAAGGAATGAVAGGAAVGSAAAAEGGVMAAGAASAPETAGIGLAIAAAIAASIEIIRHPRKSAMKAVYIGLGLFAFVAFFIMLTGDPAAGSEDQDNAEDMANALIVTKTGPSKVDNGQKITYNITVNAQNAIGDVTVTDPLPQGTTYDSSTGIVKCEGGAACTASSRTVIWKSKDNNLIPPFTRTFTITVLPNVTDKYVVNIANGEFAAISGDAKSLAQQILSNSNLNISNEAKQDLQAVVEGRLIQNSHTCRNPQTGQYNAVSVDPALLKVIATLGQKYKFSIWNLITGHGCDQYQHPKGKATDIGWSSISGPGGIPAFRKAAYDILPTGANLLMSDCPGSGGFFRYRSGVGEGHDGSDKCDHQHIDVP